MRARVAVLLVIFLIIGQIGVVSEIVNGELESSSNSIPSSISIEDFIEDPYFDSEPDTIIEGTSGEFSSNYHQGVDEEDFNYMELTWNHVANTSLDFRIEEDDNLPDCLDFIYFSQEFEWPYNEKPMKAEFQFNYSASLTGSFATEQYGNLMFRVYVWAIDSSGNWLRIYESREAMYSEIYREIRAVPTYFGLQDIWGGMIEESTGLQEDPADTVKVAIGLAPTYRFETHPFYEDDPWEFFEGSVNVRVKSMELWVYMEEDTPPSQVLLPIHSSTWEYSVREVFPDVPDEFENSSELFRDIETDTDGSVYVLCDSYSSYDYYEEEGNRFAYQFLLKYNSRLELIWAKHLENQTYGRTMAIHDGNIYTTGYIKTSDATQSTDLLVTKWSPEGDVVWQTQWGGIYDEEGGGIAVSLDGSIYVWAVYWNIRFEPEFGKSSFLKLDSSGTLLWNKTSPVSLWPGTGGLEILPDGLYCSQSGSVEKRDLTCEHLWYLDEDAFAVNFDDSGNIYTATTSLAPGIPSDGLLVTTGKWDSNGSELWKSNYSIPLPDGSLLDIRPVSIDVAPDGSVLVLCHEWELTRDYHLVKFDSIGSFLWDKIIGDERWPSGGNEPKLEISDNGLAYVGFDRQEDYGYVVAVAAFVIGQYGLNLPTIMIIVGVSGVALVAVVGIYFRKYR